METSIVRKRVSDTIERARRAAGERRVRVGEAERSFATFLESVAVPLFRQVANVLKVSGYTFTVFTPSGAVRLMSDRNAEDYIELFLDSSGDVPFVAGRSSRARGRRVLEQEVPIAEVPIDQLTDEHVMQYLMRELAPLVER
jgi:hypothetical protein